LGIAFAKCGLRRGQEGEIRMKRVLALIFVLTLLVITGTLVSTDWTNAAAPDGDGLTSVAN
jgi:hypothetical protein